MVKSIKVILILYSIFFNIHCFRSKPDKLSRHSAVIHEDKIYIYGGLIDVRPRLVTSAKLYEYNILDGKWGQLETSDMPQARLGHTANVYKDAMYVFGGYLEESKDHFTNELWKYNFLKREWSLVSTKGSQPSGRYMHSSAIYKEFLYIYGGFNEPPEKVLGDIWRLNLVTLVWQKLDSYIPMQRPSATFTKSHWYFVHNNSHKSVRLYKYSFQTNQWFTCRLPYRGNYFAGTLNANKTDPANEDLLLYGGADNDGFNYGLFNRLISIRFHSPNCKVQYEKSIEGRRLHTVSLYNNQLFIFGGQGLKQKQKGDLEQVYF